MADAENEKCSGSSPGPTKMTPLHEIRHATTVVLRGVGVMIEGPSGSGKSALALELMAFGAGLVADDRTVLSRDEDGLWADAPETLPALIEARGLGLLPVQLAGRARLRLIVDLSVAETERLPPQRTRDVLGGNVALVHRTEGRHFAHGLIQFIKAQASF